MVGKLVRVTSGEVFDVGTGLFLLRNEQGRVVRRYAPTDKPEKLDADIAALL